jgi:hypothetical protein
MPLSEAGIRANIIDPALHARGWNDTKATFWGKYLLKSVRSFAYKHTYGGVARIRQNVTTSHHTWYSAGDEHRRIVGCDAHLFCGRPTSRRNSVDPVLSLPRTPPYAFPCRLDGRM